MVFLVSSLFVAEKFAGISKPVFVLRDDSYFNGGEYHDRAGGVQCLK